MLLDQSIRTVKSALPRHAAAFAKAKARHAALAPFSSANAVVEALGESSPLSNAQRGAIVAALVYEHQLTKGEVCQGILLVAFGRTLVAMRAKRSKRANEDLDQLVLLSFFEALARPSLVRAGDFAPIALVLLTKNIVARHLQRDRRDRGAESYDAREEDGLEHAAPEKEEPFRENAEEEVARLLGATESERVRDLLLATVARDESLTDYVARCMPGLGDDERGRVVECLRSQRRAALHRLRVLATGDTGESPEAV